MNAGIITGLALMLPATLAILVIAVVMFIEMCRRDPIEALVLTVLAMFGIGVLLFVAFTPQ